MSAGNRVSWRHVTVEWDGGRATAEAGADGVHRCGPWAVSLTRTDGGLEWSVACETGEPTALVAVRVDGDAGPAAPGARGLSLGWQSWSPTRVVEIGVDPDPAFGDGGIEFVRRVYHADPRMPVEGWNRSEHATVLDAGGGTTPLLVGALGATGHDTTFWFTVADGRLLVGAAAWFGGAVLQPGEARPLHSLAWHEGEPREVLARWAGTVGRLLGARVDAPLVTGWCSWYRYFDDLTEDDFRANLAAAVDWPLEVFQLDDGYQRALGDWGPTAPHFPSGLERLAADVRAAGMRPGLWLAPFLAHASSDVGRAHPDWFARDDDGVPLFGTVNERWGGAVSVLDVTLPEVQAHLEEVGWSLVATGWTYLKLDFTYAAGLPGRFADRGATPAQRVRMGYEAVRRGAGDDAFLLACGAPLAAVVGLVDGARIGEDVTTRVFPRPADKLVPGYARPHPAMAAPWQSLTAFAPVHRRLFQNDPDCVVLGPRPGQFTEAQVEAWADRVAASGGMVLVSDDLPALDAEAVKRCADIVALARTADDAAVAGTPPAVDPLDIEVPAHLR